MSSRKRIDRFCAENGITIVELKYKRRTEWIYGSGCDDSVWTGTFQIGNHKEYFEEYTPEDFIETLTWWINEDISDQEADNE